MFFFFDKTGKCDIKCKETSTCGGTNSTEVTESEILYPKLSYSITLDRKKVTPSSIFFIKLALNFCFFSLSQNLN